MKKLVIMLLPIMPGFNAWAVHGFVEAISHSKKDAKPEPLSNDVLARLTLGSVPECSEVVCVPYSGVASFVRSFTEYSFSTAVQPLDRGGILFSFELTKKGSDLLDRMIGSSDADAPADVESVVSESK